MLREKDFEKAMQAALHGPTAGDLRIDEHEFRVHPVERTPDGSRLTVKGALTRQISWWPDDDISYEFTVAGGTRPELDDIDIDVDRHWLTDVVVWLWDNRETIIELIREWLEERGGKPSSLRELRARRHNVEQQLVEETKHLLDGSWKGEASFLIANVAGRVALGEAFTAVARTLPDDEPSGPRPQPAPGKVEVPVGRPGKPGLDLPTRPRVRDHRR